MATNNPIYNLTGKYPGNTFPVIVQIDKATGISYDGNGDSIDSLKITASLSLASITADFCLTSSASLSSISSSYALNGGGGGSLTTGSSYPITSSWSIQSISSSYSTGSVIGYGITNIITLTQAEYNALGTYSPTTFYITT